MPDEEEIPENSTAFIASYATVLVAPDDCCPSPSAKEVIRAEREAVAGYLAMLRKYRKEGLVVVMSYVESVE